MQNCEGCIHRHEVEGEEAPQCRRYPMTWQLLPTPGALQGQIKIVKQCGFPPAQDRCGEYALVQRVVVS